MKKTQTTRLAKLDSQKLRLTQETIRRLRTPELERVAGAYHEAPTLECSGYIFC